MEFRGNGRAGLARPPATTIPFRLLGPPTASWRSARRDREDGAEGSPLARRAASIPQSRGTLPCFVPRLRGIKMSKNGMEKAEPGTAESGSPIWLEFG